jgi:hypothetical protein
MKGTVGYCAGLHPILSELLQSHVFSCYSVIALLARWEGNFLVQGLKQGPTRRWHTCMLCSETLCGCPPSTGEQVHK